jgi:hypothetical protein
VAIIPARFAGSALFDLNWDSALTTGGLAMQHNGNGAQWFAERSIRGVGDDGAAEVVAIWIERKPGALWAVGRAVGLPQRADGLVRPDDYVFEGYEMGDAVAAANAALAADLDVCAEEGKPQDVPPFTDAELLAPLERWFFGRARRG